MLQRWNGVAMCLLTAMCGLAIAQEPVKIGVIEPLTGSVAYDGQSYVNGAKLAVAQRNAAGGVLGGDVQLVIEDGQCSPANSVNAAEKLIVRDRVAVLTGAFCSSATAAVQPVADRNRKILLSGVSSDVRLTEKGLKYFFRSAETDKLMSKAFSKILAKDLGLETVAYVGVNDDWGRGGVKNFSADLSEAGVKEVMVEYFDHGETDFSTLLAKLRAAKPDGIFIAAETQDGSVLVRQLKEFGVQSKVFGVGSWATADFIKLTGEASNGIYAAVPYVATIGGERNAQFVKAYSAAYKNSPGKYSAAGFNALNILMDAIARAGSTDSDAVRKAMLETDYKAPNGEYRFTDKGEAYGFDAVLVQISDGKLNIAAQTTIDKP